jgi:hypothetical protein
MKRSIVLAAGIAAITVTAACNKDGGGAAVQRQPGQWESTAKITTIQLTGAAPEIQARANSQVGQTHTGSECLTAEAARDPMAQMRQMMAQQGPAANCQFTDQVFAGGTIRIRATCPAAAGGSAELSVDGTYTATTMQATMSVNAQGPAAATMPGVTGMRLTMETTGRRTGECTGGAAPVPGAGPSNTM